MLFMKAILGSNFMKCDTDMFLKCTLYSYKLGFTGKGRGGGGET